MALVFDREFDAPVGEAVRLSLSVQRVLAPNPGIFTFKGTGTYIVGAHDVVVIDPGPLLGAHVEALKRALWGLRVTHILITHTHADHSPAAAPLKACTGAATYAFGPHPAGEEDGVEEGGDREFVPDVRLKHGDVIETGGLTIDCLHTPGHISNHMCFALREERALFTGDHVMGWSTSVIAPPDGDMTDYMASLEALTARRDRVLYPTHGGPIKRPRSFLEAYLAHRREREAQVAAALRDGPSTAAELATRLYAGLDPRLLPAAASTVLAHLIKLQKEGRARAQENGRYAPL